VPRVLTDDDLSDPALVGVALRSLERAFREYAAGDMVSPPRLTVPFAGKGSIVLTIGGSSGVSKVAGFRAYERFGQGDVNRTQIVAVWNCDTGEMDGIVLGERLGKLRMGAIGALAVRHMARPDTRVAAVIGTGPQARVQLECAAAVCDLRSVRVFSRSFDNRRAFATAMGNRLNLDISPVADARKAVEGADLVICATTSTRPVIDTAWLSPGTHINMIGSKTTQDHELSPDIGVRARVVATDAPEQIAASSPPFFLAGTEAAGRIVPLSAIITGSSVGRHAETDITLFCSGGLAGTEVILAADLLRAQD